MTSPGEGFHIASAFVEIVGDRSKLDRDIENLPNGTTGRAADKAGKGVGDKIVDGMQKGVREGVRRKLDPEMDRTGRGLGDKVSQGMRMAFIRNSPLIVAAVSAGLAAGAPLMLAASTTLFAGVGIVAAAQSQKVQSAWLGAWQQIRDSAVADAQVLVPTLVGAADDIAAGFQRMRPEIQDAFSASAPLIDEFVDSVIDASENALPGLVNSVEEGLPAIQGMGDLLRSVGTGLGEFFDIIGDHSTQAGQVFRELGLSMEELLPLLAELLGVGVDVAASMLPLLTGSLGALLSVLRIIEPIIPAVAQGLVAWKVAQTASGWIENLGNRMQVTAGRGGAFAGALGAVGGAAAAGGPAVAALAATVALVGMKMADDASNADRWARALLEGGSAARQAEAETKSSIFGMSAAWVDTVDEWVNSIPIIGQAWDIFTTSSEEAAEQTEEAQRRIRESMTESEKAAQDVRLAQNELNDAVDKYGPNSRQAADAAAALGEAQAHAAGLAEDQEMAIRGVTEAMAAMWDQSRALMDAQFAMDDALAGVAEATEAYAEAVRKHGENSDEAKEALGELTQAYRDAGAAAATLATDGLPAAVDDQTRAFFGARAELAYYRDLLAQGIDLPPYMDEHIARLERTVGATNAAAAEQEVLRLALEELGVAVTEVPDGKSVIIQGEGTEELRAKLEELGFSIERIPGTTDYKIVADDEQSRAAIETLMSSLSTLSMTTATPGVEITPGVETFGTDIAQMEGLMLGLDGLVVSPEIDAQSDVQTQTDADLEDLFSLDGLLVTPQTENQTNVPETTQQDHGLLQGLGGVVVTPQSHLNDQALQGAAALDMQILQNLGAQTPTPSAHLNSGPFQGTMNSVSGWMGAMNAWRANPQVSATAHTSNAEAALNAVARARTAIINVIQKILPAAGGSVGSYVETFAVGGQPGGKVTGPGTTTSDDVGPFRTERGMAFLSNLEWIIRASSATKYGDQRMAAVNAGTATILMPGELQRDMERYFMGGALQGPVAEIMEGMRSMRQPVMASAGPREVHFHLRAVADPRNRDSLRELAMELRKMWAEIEREER